MSDYRVDQIDPFVSSAEVAARLRKDATRVQKRLPRDRDRHHDQPANDDQAPEEQPADPAVIGAYDDHGRRELPATPSADDTQEPPTTPHINIVV